MNDFLSSLADEAADLTSVPSDERLAKIREKGMEYINTINEIDTLEEKLDVAKKRKLNLEQKELPDAFNDIGIDKLGVSDAGVDLVLKPYVHANIASGWDDDKKKAAFDHLEDLGGGDIVKTELKVTAGKDNLEAMRQLRDRVSQMLAEYEIEGSISFDLGVPWNSLTAFVREQNEAGAVLDLDKLGATIGQVVKIQKRKN